MKSLILDFIRFLLFILKRIVIILFRSKYLKYKDKVNVIKDNLEELMDFKEMLKIKGFEVEEHNIPTNYGYILTLHRISYNKLHHMTNNTCKKLKMKKTKENEKNILEEKIIQEKTIIKQYY